MNTILSQTGSFEFRFYAPARFSLRLSVSLITLLLLLGGLGKEAWAEPPKVVGGLPLVHAQRGKEALEAINRLHGKEIGGRDGYVAHYERGGLVAMLYISEASFSFQAGRQLKRMAERIQKGNTPFYHLKASERDGVTVYSALGEGQIHYFYRKGARVFWLAADVPVATKALEELLEQNP